MTTRIVGVMLPMLAMLNMLNMHAVQSGQPAHQHGGSPHGKLGTVTFATSCAPSAQPAFLHGLALLHSFEFAEAIQSFDAASAADPSCAMAFWGVALSRWGNPFAAGIKPAAQLELGRAAIEKAGAAGAKTQRERDYIAAAAQLFKDFEKIDQRTRLQAYRDALGQTASRYPDDPEASIFYALALAAAADPADKTYAGQLKAGEILARLAPKLPDHPGIAHYTIHTYDVPPLADRALQAARDYSKIAPDAPHALHMPSHTFTRLGLWQDSIDSNIASAAESKKTGSTGEELHAMDYETYAYLQQAQDGSAQKLVQALPEVSARFDPNRIGSAAPPTAGYFAMAAIPARYALERYAWAEAARLEPRSSPFLPANAVTLFARALGAARSGDLASSRAAIASLGEINERLTKAGESYWAEQVAIQKLSAEAWVALKDGRAAEALTTMRSAAEREDKTEKNAVTPGPLAPARELLGEMLMEQKQPADALVAFEATLKHEPNRFHAVAGAADAARAAGNAAAMKKYSAQLLTLGAKADGPERPAIAAARQSAK